MGYVLQKMISQQAGLPSLAKNIHVLIDSMNDDELHHKDLAEAIGNYPEIALRLIFLANSPWVAPAKPIQSIEQACSILGKSTVKSISLGMCVAVCFDTRKCPYFNTERFWTTSMLVAEGASMFASRLSAELQTSEYVQTVQTAGILHNIGILWLADNFPEETSRAFEIAQSDTEITVDQALLELIGTQYSEVSGWLGESMKLPDILVSSMKYQFDPDYDQSSWEAAAVVGSAAEMVRMLYHQNEKIPEVERLNALGVDATIQQKVFQVLSKKFERTQELARTLYVV